VRDLRRTAFSSRCRPIAGSPRQRLVDREPSPKRVGFDGSARILTREWIVHCLILTGERVPVGQRSLPRFVDLDHLAGVARAFDTMLPLPFRASMKF
jgi:hypothetical protein